MDQRKVIVYFYGYFDILFLKTEKLRQEAHKLNVTINIDQRLRDIKLVGLPRSVVRLSDLVASELKVIEKDETEKKEEVLIAKAVQWSYEDDTETWVKFHPTINKVGGG